jgi:hypothetical protein
MPCPFKVISVIFDQPLQAVKVSGVEAIIVGYANIRMQPKFGLVATLSHMDMRRLARISLVAVKEKPVAS